MVTILSDAERVARAKEVRPGVLASPWEPGRCDHGKIYSCRWVWRTTETIEDGEPEIGSNLCKKCRPEDD